jgi:hypothetical protein
MQEEYNEKVFPIHTSSIRMVCWWVLVHSGGAFCALYIKTHEEV